MFQFVRRRPLTRTAYYVNDGARALACAGVDVAAEARVRDRVCVAVATAMILAHGDDDDDDDDVERRHAGGLCEDLRASLAPRDGAAAAGRKAGPFGDPGAALREDVDAFLGRVREGTSALKKLFKKAPDASDGAVAGRRRRLEAKGAFVEARAIARAAVRAYDDEGRGACDGAHKDARDCPFRPTRCSNDGCDVVVSHKDLARHDAVCAYKRERCVCGVMVQRLRKQQHLAEDCCKRRVACPFGCVVDVAADELGDHLDEAAPAHALLLLDKLRASEAAHAATRDKLDAALAGLAVERQKRAEHDAALAALGVSVAATQKALRNTTAQATDNLNKACAANATAAKTAHKLATDANAKLATLAKQVNRVESLATALAAKAPSKPVAGRA